MFYFFYFFQDLPYRAMQGAQLLDATKETKHYPGN